MFSLMPKAKHTNMQNHILPDQRISKKYNIKWDLNLIAI